MNYQLIAIIPASRKDKLKNTIKSVFTQKGFKKIDIIISGEVCKDNAYIDAVKKKYSHLHFVKSNFLNRSDNKIYPAKARNFCLNYLNNKFNKFINKKLETWVLFIDDDVILVDVNYCNKIINFIKENNFIIAAMGNMKSYPENFWTKVIDYSNFFWLRLEYDTFDLNWLYMCATLIKYKYIKNFYLNENFIIGEDVEFFLRIAKKYKKTLGILSSTYFYHNHDRNSFIKLLKYQFNNGYNHVDWYYENKVNYIKQFIFRLSNLFKIVYLKNKKFYDSNKLLTVFVFISFFICELGVLFGSIFNKKNNK